MDRLRCLYEIGAWQSNACGLRLLASDKLVCVAATDVCIGLLLIERVARDRASMPAHCRVV